MKTADTIIEELLAGNERFLAGETANGGPSSLMKLKRFAATGQLPKAIILCCSDSRAPVEIIFDQDVGDLFVIRVAGNIVAPSLVGSVEFAAATYDVKLVLVMGHSHCGAIKATLDFIERGDSPESENLHDILSRIKPHIYDLSRRADLNAAEKTICATEANVRASVGQLAHGSRLIEGMVTRGHLKIVGLVLDLTTGRVALLND